MARATLYPTHRHGHPVRRMKSKVASASCARSASAYACIIASRVAPRDQTHRPALRAALRPALRPARHSALCPAQHSALHPALRSALPPLPYVLLYALPDTLSFPHTLTHNLPH